MILKNIKVGDRIDNNLIILEKIGGDDLNDNVKTSYGIVYIALDIERNIIVALKTFQDKFINQDDIYEDFKTESLECVKLNYHPNVIFSFGVRIINGRPFLEMEPIFSNEDGRRTLNDYFDSNLSLGQILDWSIQLCHGLEFINREGIKSHGDIKPENILINCLNIVKISDFGFLELFGENSKRLKGTPAYMAPESFKCIHNIKTDIYSFGIVLYQLANVGKLPFEAKSNFFEEWEELHKTHNVPITTKNETLDGIIHNCLEKNPNDRYSTFKELRFDLERLFLEISDNKIYVPESINLSSDFQNLSIAQAYGHYGDKELFKKYSDSLGKSEDKFVLLDYAVSLILMGDYNKSINILNKIIKRIKEDSEEFSHMDRLYFNMAHAFHELNMLYDAEEYYFKCLSENEEFIKAKVNLGNIYRDIGDFDKSLEFYDEVLKDGPDFYEALYNKAILLGYMKRFEEAEIIFNKIKYIKENKNIFYDKALMYYDTNKMKSLIELSNIEIIDENDCDALFFMILIYISDKQPDLANEKYRELIKLSDNLDYKLRIVSEYYKEGFEDESFKILNDLKNHGTSNEKYESFLLQSKLIVNKNIDESFRIWDMLLKSNASNEIKSEVHICKYVWSNHKNKDKKHLDNALKLNFKNKNAHLNYVNYYAMKKQWKKALKRVNLGLKIFPNNQEMHFLKGRINIDQGNIKDAISYFKKALKTDSPDIKIYVHLFFCYLVLENPKEVEKYFNYAINLDGYYDSSLGYDALLDKLLKKYVGNVWDTDG